MRNFNQANVVYFIGKKILYITKVCQRDERKRSWLTLVEPLGSYSCTIRGLKSIVATFSGNICETGTLPIELQALQYSSAKTGIILQQIYSTSLLKTIIFIKLI